MEEDNTTTDPNATSVPYPYRAVLVVPEAARETAGIVARQITGGGVADTLTFAIPLSATGETPPTHRACCLAVSPALLDAMQSVLAQNALPGVLYWRWEQTGTPGAGRLAATNAPFAEQILGTDGWSWLRALEDAGLQIVHEALGGGLLP